MSIVFTNGCFDILHRGHLELLKFCKGNGNTVIVGLNSDKSIKRLKGSDRPINKQEDRKYFLESLKFVNKVIVFDEDTPYNLIKKLNPDIIVKGGDYNSDEVIGKDISEVIIFDYVKGYSTTNTIKSIVNR
jgi:D-beta-D-heptose 7-phosphate kinase / D-beta-D-heptose 1-phosphate adenosyltransferase